VYIGPLFVQENHMYKRCQSVLCWQQSNASSCHYTAPR